MTRPAPAVTLDPVAAEAADQGGRITETGGYVGKLTQMKWTDTDSGAAGYKLDFEADNGQSTTGLFICTIKRNGEVNDIGTQQMSALLCCLGMRTVQPQQAQIMDDVWNEQLGRFEEQQVTAFVYPDVVGRPIGLILQKELTSRAKDGADSYRINFVRSFQHENRRTASEMIAAGRAKKEGKEIPPALIVDRTLEGITDKDSRNKQAVSHYNGADNGQAYAGSTLPTPDSAASFDDDIPF